MRDETQTHSLVSLLEQRVAETKEAEAQLALSLEAKRSERADYERALRREQERLGVQPTIPNGHESGEREPVGENENGRLFKAFARERTAAGFTIKDIFEMYARRGIKIGKNYPYYLVAERYRDHIRAEAKGKEKRYYWKETASE
jgi:hypothetical protein